jgi:hypothetical protein
LRHQYYNEAPKDSKYSITDRRKSREYLSEPETPVEGQTICCLGARSFILPWAQIRLFHCKYSEIFRCQTVENTDARSYTARLLSGTHGKVPSRRLTQTISVVMAFTASPLNPTARGRDWKPPWKCRANTGLAPATSTCFCSARFRWCESIPWECSQASEWHARSIVTRYSCPRRHSMRRTVMPRRLVVSPNGAWTRAAGALSFTPPQRY